MFEAFMNRMKCFPYFKDRARHRDQKSAPTLKSLTGWTTSDDVGAGRGGTRSSGSANSPRGIPELYRANAAKLRVFSYPELRDAAAGFSSLWKIGEGGFGCVYKGSVRPAGGGEPMVVAIKKLNNDGFQGHKQWVAEVQFLGVVDHPNLVKLVGYCAVDGERSIQRLLVYEFMPNKSLEDHLFKNSHEVLSWERRLQIMLGAAQGLAYLHEELEAQVIFRDFKASNILLDDDFNPKLSDFGLAREGPTEGQTHVSTEVMGTHGYAAPDYIETGHLTSKSDVWSFGVVLYEMLTGRRSLERDRNRPRHVQKLLDWVRQHPVDGRKFSTVLDPRLDGRYSLAAAREVARLADRCLVKSAKDRPKMSQVVERLKRISEMPPDDGASPPETAAEEEPGELTGKSKAAERRFAQLTKLSEHVGGVGKRGFMILRRAEVS